MAETEKTSAEAAFAANLRSARAARGLTQAQVAEGMARAGFKWHPPTVYKVENGERQIQFGEALELARILGLSIDEMATVDGDTQKHLEMEETCRHLAEKGRKLLDEIIDYRELALKLEIQLEETPNQEKTFSAEDLGHLREASVSDSELLRHLTEATVLLHQTWRFHDRMENGFVNRKPE